MVNVTRNALAFTVKTALSVTNTNMDLLKKTDMMPYRLEVCEPGCLGFLPFVITILNQQYVRFVASSDESI